ncbi:MAG: hypothetical protein ACRBBM_17935 [Pseudomonadaceae bacterium]
MKVSELVFYGRFRSDVHGITAEQALDLATDGELLAFYKIDAPVTIHGPTVADPSGKKYAGEDLGKWHSITVQVPRGILFDLISDEMRELADKDGKPTLLRVDEVMDSELPAHESYLLWPEGPPIRLDRNKLFFRAEDLRGLAEIQEKPLHPSERRTAGQIIAALAAMADLDISKPYLADEVLRKVAAKYGLEMPSSPETVVKFLKYGKARDGKV